LVFDVMVTSYFALGGSLDRPMEFASDCYSFTVLNSGLLFSHGRPSQQLLSSCSSDLANTQERQNLKQERIDYFLASTQK